MLRKFGCIDIKDTEFKDPEDNTVKKVVNVSNGKQIINEIISLKNYMMFLQRNGKEPHKLDWTKITEDEYSAFVVSPDNTTNPGTVLMPPSTTPTNTTTYDGQGQRKPMTEADLFKKSVRRDPALFPELNNDAIHNKWTDSMIIQAKSQLVYDVFDPLYTPTVAREEVFYLQCDYVLSVFTKVLKTDKSKSILTTHIALDKPTAAQDIWRDLLDYFKTSTVAKDQVDAYRNYLSRTRIDDGKWKGTTHAYILHFQEQVKNYDKYSKVPFTSEEKLQYLQQAVQSHPDLHGIRNTAETIFKATQTELTYEAYFELLTNAAQRYDLHFQKHNNNRSLRRSTRHVYTHDFDGTDPFSTDSFHDALDFYYDDTNDYDNDVNYNANVHNIDTTIYELNATRQMDPATLLPKSVYQQLDVTGKRAWTALPDSLKRYIVKHLPNAPSVNPKPSANPRFGQPRHATRSVNSTTTSTQASGSTTNSDLDAFVAAFKAFQEDRQSQDISSQMSLQAHQHQQTSTSTN